MHAQSQDEGTSNWQAVGPGGKDSAKEWLDKGQKWLFTAGKKVAAAAKEASSTIQNKLDEMEVFKASGGSFCMWDVGAFKTSSPHKCHKP